MGMTPYNDVRFALARRLDRGRQRAAPRLHLALHRDSADRLRFHGVHFWRVRKDGGISGPAPVMLESEIKEEKGPRPVILRPSGMAVVDSPCISLTLGMQGSR